MKQKTLNKIGKYCRYHKISLVELIIELAEFDASDAGITRAFNKLYLKNPPLKDRGGYFPHGHKNQ